MTSSPLETITHRYDLANCLHKAGLIGVGAEIGVQEAEFSEKILETWPGAGMFLIDPWKPWRKEEYWDETRKIDWDAAYSMTLTRMKRFTGRAIILKMTSNEALFHVGEQSLDFVWIDGNHHLPQVETDVTYWYDKVRRGGIFAGHDYLDVHNDAWHCDVKSVVDEFAADHGFKLHITKEDPPSWFAIKP